MRKITLSTCSAHLYAQKNGPEGPFIQIAAAIAAAILLMVLLRLRVHRLNKGTGMIWIDMLVNTMA